MKARDHLKLEGHTGVCKLIFQHTEAHNVCVTGKSGADGYGAPGYINLYVLRV